MAEVIHFEIISDKFNTDKIYITFVHNNNIIIIIIIVAYSRRH
jgi:hypothetical protein